MSILFFLQMSVVLFSQSADALRYDIARWVEALSPEYQSVGELHLERTRIIPKMRRVEIYLNGSASYLLYRRDFVNRLYTEAKSLVHRVYPKYDVVIYADKKELSFYIPNSCRTSEASFDKTRFNKRNLMPLVQNTSKPYVIKNGLVGRNIALWSSHGMYYNQQQDRWMWQRARLFSTVEDKLTLHYVLNFLTPMLENAGANVMLPHERDTQTNEVIVDNDTSWFNSVYEEAGENKWKKGGNTAYYPIPLALDITDNPFTRGSYRFASASSYATDSVRWIPDIPETGMYAVYIAYQSKENSIADAHYTVYHKGGATSFSVNQKQGGGTWIYLGTFLFEQGVNERMGAVTLTNESDSESGVVTADAVRFGGGMGCVARKPAEVDKVNSYNVKFNKKQQPSPFVSKSDAVVSGCPRYLEAARYWLQMAGFKSSVFSRTQDVNDYLDDVASRGLWVNALNNGSENVPDSVGLAIPIDLALGFHTDAGIKTNDTIVGSLGIFMTKEGNERFPNGQSRYASRDLSDMVLSEIEETVTRQFTDNWSVRGLWNKSYIEARIPQVPTMLLELLSHQNSTDIRHALDPHFQFAVSRAVYKAIVKYLALQKNEPYTIQPLPVNSFYLIEKGNDSIRLCWTPTLDSLSADGAAPTGYVVYTRINDDGFDNGIFTADTTVVLPVRKNELYQFKVSAVNAGGESFPSETLSACFSSQKSHTLLVVNGFDRLSAPDFFETTDYFGIALSDDCGVPYQKSCFFTGNQYDFLKSSLWLSDDAPGLGASGASYEKQLVVGNTFDYTAIHGKAIAQAGFSFVSGSRLAVERGLVNMNAFKAVDYIAGKQRSTLIALDSLHTKYKVLSEVMQQRISDYCQSGGTLFLSGSYLGSDMCGKADMYFLNNCLKVKKSTVIVHPNGLVGLHFSPLSMITDSIRYCCKPSAGVYNVTSSDAFLPADGEAFPVLRYDDNGTIAAVAYRGRYRLWVMGFPFETILEARKQQDLMVDVLNFLIEEK